MEDKYKSLDGKIFYKSKVHEIIVEDGIAKGISLEDGTKKFADIIISAANGHTTLFNMLDGKYLNDDLKTLYSDSEAYPVYTTVQVSLGINEDISKYPHTRHLLLDNGIDCGGKTNKHIGLRHYNFDKTLMPEGKSVLVSVMGADFNWWKEKYQNRELYLKEKERIGKEVKEITLKYYPDLKDKIDVIDVATPMTYVRYCNAWQGAWMAWATTPKGKIRYVPGNLPGLEGFYLTGQWTMPPGGLPTAVITGRWVIQRLCSLEKKKFITSIE